MRARIIAIALACVGSVACGRSEKKKPITASGDIDPVEAALRSARTVLPVAHRVAETATATVRDGDRVLESLGEEGSVERGAGGEVHAAYVNSKDHGRELYAAKDTVWVRPRYGKFHRRPPTDEQEIERTAAEVAGLVAAQLELVAPGLELVDAGPAQVAGRAAHKLSLKGGAGSPRPARGPSRAWRDSLQVESVEGELTVDDASGALLGARLAAKVGFVRDGERLQMELSSKREVTPGAVAIPLPTDEQSSPTPHRSTEFDDREELLSGIAPPGRRSPSSAAKAATQ